ncbi:unnamed protein product [Eruca vesicaria subsp. sativa]|uniref:Uncharacterized protein n=1 Tax=Eruca vesicaria subsp. sativa TaxID=29727 RepID=A0ABC8J6K1_ERUVS|nr:unnamed protein product [Eruca vesicaria subsp. sativa]
MFHAFTIDNHSPSNLKKKGSLVRDIKLSHQMINSIKLHGILLWVSMGLLMPMGVLFIRMGNKATENGRKVKVFFYLHVIFQFKTNGNIFKSKELFLMNRIIIKVVTQMEEVMTFKW